MNTAVLGMLWGDEAKAKIIQSLLPDYDVVVRFQGAANAGHTVYLEDDSKLVLHAIPVGVIKENAISVIAAGCSVNPITLINEITELERRGIKVKHKLKIYSNTTITTQFEVALDSAWESIPSKGSLKIGTTKKGVGPSYSDRFFRTAVLFEDLFDKPQLSKKLQALSKHINPLLKACGAEEISPISVLGNLCLWVDSLRDLMVYPNYVGSLIEQRKNLLFEGAQGALLCPINGSYPFVTAFPVHTASIPISCNIPMKHIHKTIGVLKAYPTRVGEGPFPTEMPDAESSIIRSLGNEFGATTGRPRRCGWPDLAIASYVVKSFGIDEIALTCLDTICNFSRNIGNIKVYDSYKLSDKASGIPQSATSKYLLRVNPVYQEMDLECNCSGMNSVNQLPFNATNYINMIENITKVPITMISTGKNMQDIIIK